MSVRTAGYVHRYESLQRPTQGYLVQKLLAKENMPFVRSESVKIVTDDISRKRGDAGLNEAALCDCQRWLGIVSDREMYLVGLAVFAVVNDETHIALFIILSVLALVIDSQL